MTPCHGRQFHAGAKKVPGIFLLSALCLLALVTVAVAQGPRQGAPQRHRTADARSTERGTAPRSRAPFELSEKHQAFLRKVLNYWEYRSGKIKTYRTHFKRWEYDPNFGPREWSKYAKTISTGVIKYAKPDKGMLKVEHVYHYVPPAKPGEKAKYRKREGEQGEHWICDGKSIFQFDYAQKRLIQRELPPDMQGKAVADGPLPFLFGAKAEELQARFWMKIVTPPDAKGEYWILAVPKRREDAANYRHVEIIIDEKDFLPKALQIFLPDGRTRVAYDFSDRTVNAWEIRSPFASNFYEPQTPHGWKKVVERYRPISAAGKPSGARNARGTQPRR